MSDVNFVSLLAGRQSHVHWQQISDEHMCLSNSCPVGITLDILSERELFFRNSAKHKDFEDMTTFPGINRLNGVAG